MPELPEVATIRLGLNRLLIGRTIKALEFDWPKSFPNDKTEVERFLINAKIFDVRRRAKILIIDLSSHYSLLIHLKMTGQLVYVANNQKFGAGHPSDSLVGKLPDRSTRVTISLSGEAKLYFNDQRKFGWIKLVPTEQISNLAFFQKVGPEPLDPVFSWQKLKTRLASRQNSSIKAALLDQSVIAGVGNIYADESLWAAKIHPATRVKDISARSIHKLHDELISILKLSIKKGGSTDKNYVNAEGKKGSYLSFAKVFRRENQPCPRCGHTIQKIRVAGRGTHFCPFCQKLKRPT
jgi:formamidopyrimidine-DNA glycosylase